MELRQLNVIIGPQSSGKSCVLKIACYCSWVEKRIQIHQSPEQFEAKGYFEEELIRFHKMDRFIRNESYIEYETDTMRFSFTKATNSFEFSWKEGRWDYIRSKLSYIPSERNLVAAIPNWLEVKLQDNNIRSFMSDWNEARKAVGDSSILNLGVDYHYDPASQGDVVRLSDGLPLDFTNTSSGLQSLIPLYVFIKYLMDVQFTQGKKKSVSKEAEDKEILEKIYNTLFVEQGKTKPVKQEYENEDGGIRPIATLSFLPIGDYILSFSNMELAEECKAIYERYIDIHHCNIFLEEPESNLFPPTQSRLIDWLLGMIGSRAGSTLFVATHSPYVLTSLMENPENDLAVFFIHSDEAVVKTASEEDVQAIYDDGFDAFYNIESLG